jgi:IS1 family transposase
MNRLTSEKRAQVIGCLIEGCSIRSTVRLTGVAMKTVMRVLVEVGEVCADYQDKVFQNLRCRRLQLDEMWCWIYCKERNRTEQIAKNHPDAGDIWLWTAVDADSKLVPCWSLGGRDTRTAVNFVCDLASRLKNRVQITTDGHRPYIEAVETAFGREVDYSILQKIYGSVQENETRYSPSQVIGIEVRDVIGNADPKHISTSYVERHNWTLRGRNRRYTRLSNGFSRKLRNHAASVALNYFAYNFIQIHKSLRTSPAQAAGVTDHLWGVTDLVALWESYEKRSGQIANAA